MDTKLRDKVHEIVDHIGIKDFYFHPSLNIMDFCFIDCINKMAENRPFPKYLSQAGYKQHLALKLYNGMQEGKNVIDVLYGIIFPNKVAK